MTYTTTPIPDPSEKDLAFWELKGIINHKIDIDKMHEERINEVIAWYQGSFWTGSCLTKRQKYMIFLIVLKALIL